jgi:hypothetical protein
MTEFQNSGPPSCSQPPIFNVPYWARTLLWPFVALSVMGVALSLWVHVGAVIGEKVAPSTLFVRLHVGCFVVFLPVFILSRRRTDRRNFWKTVLRGSPGLRYMVYIFTAYAVVNFLNFLLFMSHAPVKAIHGDPPVEVWRGFSGHWMAFYSAALAVLLTAAQGRSDSQTQPPP